MIHEIALFPIKAGQRDAFQRAFREVTHLLARATGYHGHVLMQEVENPSHFNLIVRWQSLEDHQGFEASDDHDVFMTGLQAYLAAEPSVHHVRILASTNDIDILSA